jgi:tetratricopeptide (TPR) repeat protein
MPNCLTKSSVASRCLLRVRWLPRFLRVTRASLRQNRRKRRRSAIKLLASKVAKRRTVRVNARTTRLSNARKLAIPMRKNAAKTKTETKIATDRNRPIVQARSARLVRSTACGLFAALACLLSPVVLCQSRAATASFEQGRAAFEREDYSAAIASFEAALAAKMSGPAIHYNIGVAAYRLQRYDRARFAFEEVARTPAMEAIARYNLGLIAKAEGDERKAMEEFGNVYAHTADERLRSLARAQLNLLEPPAALPTIAWAGFIASGLGYDDNVTLTSNGQALGIAREGDVYGDTQLVGSATLSSSWRIDADAALLNYAELDEFDQWDFGTGGRYRFATGDWTWDVGGQLGTSYINSDRFDVRHALYLQALRPLTKTLTLRGRYRLTNVDGSKQYPGLDGLRHELTMRLMTAGRTWTASCAYLLDMTDYDSPALSATRHQLLADARTSLTQKWTAAAALSYRQSNYDNPAFGVENRTELTVAAERSLSERWTLVMQYSLTDNDADVDEFAYRRNRLFAGIEAIF